MASYADNFPRLILTLPYDGDGQKKIGVRAQIAAHDGKADVLSLACFIEREAAARFQGEILQYFPVFAKNFRFRAFRRHDLHPLYLDDAEQAFENIRGGGKAAGKAEIDPLCLAGPETIRKVQGK